MVHVFVGPKCKSFHLHKALLCYHSKFFQKALDGGFKEQDDKAVYLPDDDVGAFVLFVNWIYNAPPQKASTTATATALFGLYIMADKFCIEELQNLSMDVFRASHREGLAMSSDLIEHVYVNTPESSPMRRFIVNFVTYGFSIRKLTMSNKFLELMKKGGDFAADFASAILQYSFGATRPLDPRMGRDCAYHEHNSSKPCP